MADVLLYHRDPAVLHVCRTALEHAHFNVTIVLTGADAIRKACERAPDLIVMAYAEPREVNALRAAAPRTPILASTHEEWHVGSIVRAALDYIGAPPWRHLPTRGARPIS